MVHKDIKATVIKQLKKRVSGMEAAAQGTEEKNARLVLDEAVG